MRIQNSVLGYLTFTKQKGQTLTLYMNALINLTTKGSFNFTIFNSDFFKIHF